MLAKSADLFFIKILKRIEWKYVFWVLPSLNNDMLFKCCKAVCWTDFYFSKNSIQNLSYMHGYPFLPPYF